MLAPIPPLLEHAIAQAPPKSEVESLSVEEFRQTLVEFGAYLDAHKKGTNFSRDFQNMPQESLQALLSGVPNPRQFQAAVTALQHSNNSRVPTRNLISQALGAQSATVYPNCPADTIIDTSSNATCLPSYPDPSNTAWQAMVNGLITFGAFSPDDFADVSSQQCNLTVESNLAITSNSLLAGLEAATDGCSALNDVPAPATAACFGPLALTLVPAAYAASTLYNLCQEQDGNVNAAEIDAAFHNTVTIYDKLGQAIGGINTIQTDISSVTTDILGLDTTVNNDYSHLTTDFTNLTTTLNSDYTNLNTSISNAVSNIDNTVNNDFTTVNNNINATATQIGVEIVNSTTTITNEINSATTQITNQLTTFQNLELRLKIEENLTNNSNPIGSFELPNSQNGYLELALSIVADVIKKLSATGQEVHNAQAKLATANADYAAGNYKQAYKDAGLAYSTAVN